MLTRLATAGLVVAYVAMPSSSRSPPTCRPVRTRPPASPAALAAVATPTQTLSPTASPSPSPSAHRPSPSPSPSPPRPPPRAAPKPTPGRPPSPDRGPTPKPSTKPASKPAAKPANVGPHDHRPLDRGPQEGAGERQVHADHRRQRDVSRQPGLDDPRRLALDRLGLLASDPLGDRPGADPRPGHLRRRRDLLVRLHQLRRGRPLPDLGRLQLRQRPGATRPAS